MRQLVVAATIAVVACSDSGDDDASDRAGDRDGGASGRSAAGKGASSGGGGALAAGSGGGGRGSIVGLPAAGGDAGVAGRGTSGGSGSAMSGSGGSTSAAGAGGSGGAGTTVPGCVGAPQGDYQRPMLDKSCGEDGDCFAGPHTYECCGSQIALGYNVAVRADFEAYEVGCRANLCPCPAKPAMAEDGSPLPAVANAVAECRTGKCIARAPDAEACDGPMECIDLDRGGMCVSATGPTGNGTCGGGGGFCFLCDCAAPDTPIATPDGERPIAALEVGDLVYSQDEAGIVVVPILRVSRLAVFHHRVMQVRLVNGRTIAISPGHPTVDGRPLGALRTGDVLGDVPIVSVQLIDYPHAFTHDILPASSSGTYFAAGAAIGSTLH